MMNRSKLKGLKRLVVGFVVLTGTVVTSTPAVGSEVSRNNYVDWTVVSAKGSSTSHLVQFKNPLNTECTENRVRFSVEDSAVLSVLLAAKLSGKKVGLYYDLKPASSEDIPGHGAGICQLVNVWLESD